MMDGIVAWADGLALAMAPAPLGAMGLGIVLGSAVGLWPSAGTLAALALLMPVMAGMDTLPALVLLAGIHLGAQVGGAWGTVLTARPGEAAAMASAADTRALVRQGRTTEVMTVAALTSCAAGLLTLTMVVLLVPAALRLAFHFGPAEYAALTVLALAGTVAWSPGSTLKAAAMAVAGLLLGPWLAPAVAATPGGGVGFVALVVGVFLLAEVVTAAAAMDHADRREGPARGADEATGAPGPASPTGERRRAAAAAGRGTMIGAVLGAVPGGGAVLASVAARAVERRLPLPAGDAALGHGTLRGVAAPEAANSAGAQAAFLPALTLGLPANVAMALLLGALALHGVTAGPALATTTAPLLWGLLGAAALAHLGLLALALAMVRLWGWGLRAPRAWRLAAGARPGRRPGVAAPAGLAAAGWSAAVTFAALAVWALHPEPWIAASTLAACGGGAVLLQRLGCPVAPLVLGVVLWPALETQVRRLWALDGGSGEALLDRPLAMAILAAAVGWVGVVALARWRAGATRHAGRGGEAP